MDNNKPVTELPVKAPFDFAKWWDRVGILIVLLVLLILMSTFAPNFNRVDNLLNIARSISVNAILAAGMTFVILTSGIDLSVGSIVAVSGVVSVVAAMAGRPAPLVQPRIRCRLRAVHADFRLSRLKVQPIAAGTAA